MIIAVANDKVLDIRIRVEAFFYLMLFLAIIGIVICHGCVYNCFFLGVCCNNLRVWLHCLIFSCVHWCYFYYIVICANIVRRSIIPYIATKTNCDNCKYNNQSHQSFIGIIFFSFFFYNFFCVLCGSCFIVIIIVVEVFSR